LKLFFKKFFPATIIRFSHLAIWFILIFSFVTSNLFATDYTITVTASGSSNYIFNSSGLSLTDSNDPDISVNVGDKLIFDATSSTLATHPFAIVSALNSNNGYSFSNEVSGVTNNAKQGVTITWDLTGVAPGEYFYVCVNHPEMRGKITVSSVGPDSDGDGVNDDVDVDDDNDGILDTIEGETDTDGDGKVNRLDLDSDGDGCYDVIESGYGDLDDPSDGKVGTEPTEYTSDGKVKSVTYKFESEIEDLDGNGTKDFLEKGSDLSKVSDPTSVNVLEYSNVSFTASGSTVGDLGTIKYTWQITTNNGNSWVNVSAYTTANPSHPGKYSDYDKTTMKIDSVTAAMTEFKYRLLMQTLAYSCDLDITSSAAQLTVYKTDTDGDNVPDDDDLDDDNDGILDTEEGGQTLDTDGDGTPNRLDLDSDNDGCNDVVEAGFTDGNNDGKVGIPTIQVDASGRVVSAGGESFTYTTPSDSDGNSTLDFLEEGSGVKSYNQPSGVITTEGQSESFTVTATGTSEIVYKWQISSDNGVTWTDVQNASPYSGASTKTLTIDPITSSMNGDQFRLVMSTPSYACAADVTTSSAQLIANDDFDGDGVADDTDLDDDNDGITDVLEGTGDFDGDGIPNSLDLDSDNDGCNDVVEAGYIDGDNDGILGVAPYKFLDNGLVDGTQTYKDFAGIDDLDGNSTKDYLEKGTALSKTIDPVNVTTIEYSKVTFTGDGETVGDLGTITRAWQITTDDGDTWTNVSNYISNNPSHPGVYSGLDSTVLVIDSVISSMDRFAYRLYMKTPAYKCDQDVTTNDAQLRVYKQDSDGDNIPDELDYDDDNDGITDVNEGGEDLDTDGDGTPNRIDLDSDGDGCNDVNEAVITTDENNDGRVGIPVVVVNSNGLVTSSGAGIYSINNSTTYTGIPADLDGNGVFDFLESSSAATVDSSPSDVTTKSHGAATFVAKGTSAGTIEYTWQVSTDAGNTFTDIDVFDNKGEQSEIMIVGGGNPVFDNNYQTFLEFYANTDIPSNKYKVRFIAQDESYIENNITTGLSAGQYFVVGQHNNGWVQFFGDIVGNVYGGGNYKYARWSNISNFYFDQRIEIRRQSDDAIVDVYGEETNLNGNDEAYPWVSPEGFFKRKDNRYATNEFKLNDWTLCSGCLDKNINANSSTPYPYKQVVLPATSVYTGHDDDTLKIHAAPRNFDRYQYRARIRTLNFVCDDGSFTTPAELVVFLDTDGDGVGDANDLDDDNDGILDTEEGNSTDDFDGDGIPNSLDSDSDGDGCSDVIEAGFTDPDGDGIPGTGAPSVGTDGKITGHSYTDPQDLNSNQVDDFLEHSTEAGIYTQPKSVFLDEEEDTIFVSQATLQTQFMLFWKNEPNEHSVYNATMNSNGIYNKGWSDVLKTGNNRFVVEFDFLTNGSISGYTYMFQYRGHSYYLSTNTFNFDTSVSNAQSAGGYVVVINDHYESELVREGVRKIYSNINFWINHYFDKNSSGFDGTETGHNATGWVSGYIPNSEITYQWEVGVINGNDTTWSNVADGTNYAGATDDTLRVKSAPANFDKNLYRMKASPKVYACSSGPAYSLPAQLTVSSDPDNDGIKNSVDLDDDNDGILDTEEGGKDLDTDGDGVPNRLDLDSDGDGCLDVQEAGFSGYDSNGRLCADASCAGSDGKVTGHSYATPADGDGSGVSDYLEAGQSPTISTDLNSTSIAANGSSIELIVNTTIDGISPASSYTNWHPNEPNNTGNYNQVFISSGLWDDMNYSWNWYVVEFNSSRDDAISGFTKLMDDYKGHSYYVSNSYERYWTTAKSTAESLGGYLVVIEDAAENQLVYEAVRAVKGTSRNYWIGHYQDTGSSEYYEPLGGWTTVTYPSVVSYTWQVSADSTTWTDITASNDTVSFGSSGSSNYAEYTTNSLTINDVLDNLNGYQYRVIAGNPGFLCAVSDTSTVTTLIVRDDFDGDGIRDEIDVDDDNDGILDTNEGNSTTDTDGDGSPDTKDLDSDGDGCYDVDEAYGTGTDRDPNDDGIFGDANPTINSNGSVSGATNTSGLDQDGNGVKDFQEAGAAITSMSCPDDITATEGANVEIITVPSGQGETVVNYLWQVSTDTGTTWTDIDNNDSEIIISGIGYGKTGTNYDGYPKFIEIYALRDADLRDYRMRDNMTNQNTYYYSMVMNQLDIQMKKGEYLLIYGNGNTIADKSFANTFFGANIDDLYDHVAHATYFYQTMQGGDDSYALERRSNNTWSYVDRVGNGYANVLSYDDGWLYRKSGTKPTPTYTPDQWTQCKDCLESSTNATASTSFPLKTFTSPVLDYDYSKGDSLQITDISKIANGYQFRAIASTPGFVCGVNDTTCAVTVSVVGDNDRDGIPDATDIDDDNDGILDSVEGEDTDTDGDGILDKFDLDSDGDGCFDVQEAGFSDPDGDGLLGTGTPEVTTNGGVKDHTYSTPLDGDGNGTADYKEVGSSINIVSYSSYFLSEGGDTATYSVDFTNSGTAKLHWQVSKDNASTWNDITAADNGTGSSGDTEVCIAPVWGSAPWNWTDGVLEDTIKHITIANDAIIKVNENTDVVWDAGYPKIENSVFGGVKTLGLSLDPKSGSGQSAVTTTITFTKPADGVKMLITDIDSKSNGWKDKVVVTSDAGNPSADSLNTSPTFSVSGNTLTAKDNTESTADNKGTARLTFPDGVTTITIVYSDVSGMDDPESRGIGLQFEGICVNTGSATYSGVFTKTLSVNDIRQGMDEWRYRLRITTPGYACHDTTFSQPARLDVNSDFDNDGILNADDLDDDNDGILDTEEGDGDLDGDGLRNRFDLDSDGDGCYDVIEAGFTDKILDSNNDGILGDNKPYTVDSLGRITSGLLGDGYSTPDDADNNGVKDFLQFGQNILNAVLNNSSLTMLASGTGSFKITASVPSGDVILYQWQESRDGGTSWFNVPEQAPYSGTQTSELTLTQPDAALTGYKYRVLLTIPSYVCSTMPLNLDADLTVYPDNDKDGVRDSHDEDDDNDGILDSYEGTGNQDNDQDGIPNRFDLDADGDGCLDVLEAGFLDANGDGLIGPDSVITMFVDSLNSLGVQSISSSGRVNSFGGYTEPSDLDNNGTYDFLEEGAPITAVECPDSVVVNEGGSAIFSGLASVTSGNVSYQWEITKDSGNTWSDITESGLMFIGLGQGYRSSSDEGRPKFIELIATKDIDNLSKYRIYGYQDGSTTNQYSYTLSGSVNKGDKIILYYDYWQFYYFFGKYPNYAKAFPVGNLLRYGMRGGDDVFELTYSDKDGNQSFNRDKDIVDVIGVRGKDGTGENWEYYRGWLKRKDNKYASEVFKIDDWNTCNSCFGTASTNESASSKYILDNYSTTQTGKGSETSSLTLQNVSYDEYHGALVRVKVSTPAYICGEGDTSCVARISVIPVDSDEDGVPDRDDADDDNDGILDVDEGGEDLDTDGDGIPNRIDYDSDGDGCSDVLEGGFSDPDEDGIIGSGSPTVDSSGKVDGHDYDTPADADTDGTKDFLQVSSQAVVTSHPIDVVRQGGDDAEFNVIVTGESTVTYQWQVSDDDTVTWTDLENGSYYSGVNTTTLSLTAVTEDIDGFYYRLKVLTPSLVCADPVYSNAAKLTAKDDSDGDGIDNNFDLDSDNDGILNTVEDPTLDTDGDGTPDYLDLDSDGDGCYDVVEAGYDDPDGDGRPGTGDPVIIPGIGMVDAHPYGVTDEHDSDDNGVKDWQEAGGPLTSITNPSNVVSSQGKSETFTVSGTAVSPISYQWQTSEDNGTTWANILESVPYSGTDMATLTIDPISTTMNSNLFRAILSTPGFVCGVSDTTQSARLIALPDNDNDGIQDLYDEDDDNDGILDVDEFIDDLDGDGKPNSFDLDSDGDGCLDVEEAGFLDPNGDGILGDSVDTDGDGIKDKAATVNSSGRVTSGTGYSTPDDLDGNDVKDYLESGSQVVIDLEPNKNNNVSEFSDLELVVNASSDAVVNYQWQTSADCENWTDIDESPALMITGLFETKNRSYFGIELYAVRDIDNLNNFGITVSGGTTGSSPNSVLTNTTLAKGQYYMLYYNSAWTNFFSDETSSPHKSEFNNETYNMARYDRFNISLYEKKNNTWKKVDVYGDHSQSAQSSLWDVDEGWAYRKNGRGTSTVYKSDDWNIKKKEFSLIGGTSINGNDIVQDGYPLFRFSGPTEFTGVNNDTLKIVRTPLSYDDKNFRVIVTTPGFKCDTTVYSVCANLRVEPMSDTDSDGVPDYVDLDSDNDGIPDLFEGCDIDTDGDGVPNCLDLDSDNDGCNDVLEAGFTDEDGDGYLGPDDLFVDVNGLVSSGIDGYTDPNDLDNNGVNDYIEAGDTVTIIDNPSTVNVLLYDDTVFVGSGTSPSIISQRWQQSDDGGVTFRTLQNTPSLIITGVMEANRSGQRPKLIEFKALRDVDCLKDYKVKFGTSEYSLGGSSCVSLSKGDFYYVVYTTSDAVNFLAGSGPKDDFSLYNYKYNEVSSLNSQLSGKTNVTLEYSESGNLNDFVEVDRVEADDSDNYNKGWRYKKDTTQVSTNYRSQDWTSCSECLNNEYTNLTAGSGPDDYTVLDDGDTLFYSFPVASYGTPIIISGVNSGNLKIENIPYSMNGYKFNLEMQTPGFACDPDVSTDVATLNVFLPDYDNDGFVDKLDLDADNDGILDSDEDTTDIDGDGFPNYIDLDSDGDGCFDAVEAGFADPDNDGYLGTSPVVVGDDGKVLNQGGYSTPSALDLDGNGVMDYKEAGSQVTIVSQPNNQVYYDDKAKFYVVASSDGTIEYQWQIQLDTPDGDWTNLVNAEDFSTVTTDTLNVDNILDYSANNFRVMLTTPGYACGDTVYSVPVMVVNSTDWDEDGIPDNIDIDDDNDGIIDISEGEDIDTDGDGIPNSKDNDSDGDGCYDAVEAGYEDGDDDGFLGTSPFEVTSVGTVIGHGGYQPPEDDLDNNGVLDLLEVGSDAVESTVPLNDTLIAGGNASFTGSFTADGTITYKWQYSVGDDNWIDVVDTLVVGQDTTYFSGKIDTTLNITNVTFAMNEYQFRLVASTPSYKCGPDTPSTVASIKLAGDNDEDGIIDIIDLDDDNDGILDSIEGGGDTDGDGIPDWFDLDSDGDGCFDVEEAGFEDPDNDGVLCNSPVVVDGLGKVVCIEDSACEEDPYTNMSWNTWSSAAYITDQEKSPGYYRLTQKTSNNYGSVFRSGSPNSGRVDLRGDFVIEADLYFGDENGRGNGIAFNITRNNNSGSLYNYGELAMNFSSALSVEFDTRDNGSSYNDIVNDHSSLHINGNNIAGTSTLGVTTTSGYSYYYHSERPINIVDLGNIEDGKWKEFRFIWSASTKTITVEFEGVQIMTYQVDIIKDVLSDSNLAYFGFTSDGYPSTNEQRVYIKSICEVDDSLGESIYKGYKDPNDLDGDGVYDFKQAGGIPEFYDSYDEDGIVVVKEGADTTFTTRVEYDGPGDIVWQMCNEDCSECTIIEKSPGLMMTGIFRGDIAGIEPSVIELYALENIPDLSVYGIEIASDGSSADGKDYSLSAVSLDSGKFYSISSNDLYYKSWFGEDPSQQSLYNNFDGDDAIILYKNDTLVDVFGAPGKDGSGELWDYTLGWAYRKDGRIYSSSFNVNDWKTCRGCSFNSNFNGEMDNPFPLSGFAGAPTFEDVDSDNLTLKNATSTLDGVRIRRAVIDPAYACQPVSGGHCIRVGIFLDNDQDGIIDEIDLDDDNDGILDTLETDGDTDGDGIPNHFDLDSDGDGCLDAVEAGFTDGDDDGLLGNSPVTVDTLGLVTSGSDGYTLPADNDNSGGYDFLEFGTVAVLVSSPDTVSGTEGSELYLVAQGTAVGGAMNSYPFNYTDWVTIDNASWQSSYFYLTSTNYRDGQLWNKKKIQIDSDFVISSKINLGSYTSTGGEGIAFVLHNVGTSAYGSNYGYLGYISGNISNALAVEFDTHGQTEDVVSLVSLKNGYKTVKATKNVSELEDGAYRNISISWDSNTHKVTVLMGGQEIVSCTIDMKSELFGVDQVNFGFTASTGSYWNYQSVKDISVSGILEGDATGNVVFDWQVSTDSATTWVDITSADSLRYSGIDNDTLTIIDVPKGFDGHAFRTSVRNPAFACDPGVMSQVALLEVLPDNDNDGIPDDIDVDDDNDGILDTKEDTTDLDGDGIPNHFDLDSDGDGCFDVLEAGFDDNDLVFDSLLGFIPNPDGVLGNSPVKVDDLGRVIQSSDGTTSQGYFKPKDGDTNGTEDYREVGSAAFIISEPITDRIDEGDTIVLGTVVDVTGNAVYEWYESRDTGKVWIKLPPFAPYSGVDKDTLSILGAPVSMNGYQYKMVVSTPAYACGENDTTSIIPINVSNDNDEDGIPNDIDIDDDNDGIVDTLEVVDSENDDDYDNDGIPNHYDLDSDGDGCFDVLEAGFSDPDGDGILCTSPVIVNNVGQVIGCSALGCNSIDDEDYNLVGDAEKWTDDGDNEVYRLTEDRFNQSGSVWSKEKIDLNKDFKVEAKLNLGSRPGGADGIAFVIQPLASDLGGTGGGLGYAGISPSVAVEFDTWNNYFSGTASNHAAVIFDGVPYGPHTNLHIFDPSIEDGLYHEAVFNWTAQTQTLTVSWDGIVIITLTKDIVTDIFSGDGNVFYGFTAATGSATNNQVVWLENVCVPTESSNVPVDGYTDPLDADGSGVVDYKEVDDFTIDIATHPSDVQVPDKTTGYVFVDVNSSDTLSYQWQKSSDSLSWTNVTNDTLLIDRGEGIFDTLIYMGANADTLFIMNIDTILDSTYYRVLVDIPTAPCADETPSNAAFMTVVTDIDLDNDGISNADEGYGDTDGDGIPNYLDLDSDNDGIPDVIEGGDGDLDTNGDGMIDENDVGFADVDEDGMADDSETTPQPDTDGDGTPDFLDIDSDNDGIFDVVEGGDGDLDTNGDGMIDDNDDGFSDEDNNGMDDDSESTPQPDYDGDGNPDYLDIDSDNDGIFDVDEGGSGDLDTNDDGVIDDNDTGFSDVDNDGMDDDSEIIPAPDSDGDGNPDYLDIDSDNDGIFDVEEGGDGDLDTNNDGVIDTNDTGYSDADGDGMDDSSEPTSVPDTDGDGKPNYLDIDSDNDGIFDVDEGGDGGLDTNNDGVIDTNDTGYSDVDGDGMDDDSESTPVVHTDGDEFGDGIPDYLDLDSDNDGIFDVDEGGDGDLDTNNDGVIDTNDTGYVDSDNDGMDDDSESTLVTNSDFDLVPDYQDIDSDNDGIFDVVEGGDGDLDVDGDGVIGCICSQDNTYFDLDGDGMNDNAELTSELDSDLDGIPNYLDIDSDDDGIYDVEEGGDGDLDTNNDGEIDSNDTDYSDSDGDGMDDDSESTPATETDSDTLPDYIDIDSDNDGIQDVVEGGDGDLDTNGDGVINSGDTGYTDTDGDGMDDDSEATPVTNSDNDQVPDYQDIDSDNDGIFDVVEGGDGVLDTNNDGVLDTNDNNYIDLDGDGMFDPALLTDVTDSDGDANPDYIDIDSDNDGIHDVTESGDGNLDTNADGAIDSNDSGYTDTDGDGMDDDSEPTDVLDTDGDSLPNHLDIDSDNDGIYDVEEGGDSSLDTNDDGVINDSDTGYSDADDDGMDDDSESTPVTNTDNDGNPDFVDIDSDNDGIQDVIEGGDGVFDTNGDGMIDTLDNDVIFTYVDADGDGMADQTEDTPVIDSDGDGANDYQDLDSDNDGIFDVVEGGDGIDADFDEDGTNEYTDLDTNDDGMIDSDDAGYVDADNDGMADSSEDTGQPNSDVTEDLDDGIPNYLDLDSDDDGCNDVVEAGFTDLDGDGILGEGTPVIDTNGLVVTDEDEGYVEPVDSDNNGILDCYDALILVVNINSHPQYAGTVFQGDNVSYSVDVTVDGDLPAEYQWQMGVVSDDEQDTTWTDLANGLQFSGVDTDSITITNVTFDEFDNTLYRVKVTATGYKCAFVLSEPAVLDVKFRDLHIPQGFSPNNDGTNDVWVITGIDYYPNSIVQIYNRWELKVFEMEGYENDDPQKYFEGIANFGNTNGKLLPETVYFYVIDLGDTDIDGNLVDEDNRYRKGFVYIRRGNE